MLISGFKFSIEVPDGWSGRVFKRPELGEDTTMPILQAASTPLSVDDQDLAPDTRKRFGADDALLVVLEQERPRLPEGEDEFPPLTGALTLDEETASVRLHSVPPEHTALLRRLKINDRYWTVVAVFGSNPPSPRAVAIVGEALLSLNVEPLTERPLAEVGASSR